MKIIGIIGSRTRATDDDLALLLKRFKEIYQDGDWICSGGCPTGGDKFADKIARNTGIPILTFYAAWDVYGKAAGFHRNTFIAKNSNVLISLKNKEGSGGAEDTCKKFLEEFGGSLMDLHII